MSREALDARLIAMLDAIGHVPETPVTADELRALVQAAEAATARRCAEIANKFAMEYRVTYKGTIGPDGIRRGGTYDPHADGASDGAAIVEDAIRAEYPEAFK